MTQVTIRLQEDLFREGFVVVDLLVLHALLAAADPAFVALTSHEGDWMGAAEEAKETVSAAFQGAALEVPRETNSRDLLMLTLTHLVRLLDHDIPKWRDLTRGRHA
jgi:hypothetical protein